ncbi:MAG: ATP-binding protein [Fusobacteriaceae bacterium]
MAREKEVKLTFRATLENLSLIRAMIKTYLEVNKIPSKDIFQILSIVDELATNVVEHGYEYSSGDISILVEYLNDTVKIIVEDYGVGFDENKVSKEDGGIGLAITAAIANNFKIEKKESGTIFTVEKKIYQEGIANDNRIRNC